MKRSRILISVLMLSVLILPGCFLFGIGHPMPVNEIYKTEVSEADNLDIYLHIVRWGDDYPDGTKGIWVVQADGTTWHLDWLDEDPSMWKLVRRNQNGTEEVIPLRSHGATMKYLKDWPGEWELDK
ncbi:MAG: hypothetical protein GY869_11345 [Planctomycetes bacterium]|nr:hypothetical protein [Planctomycetota bacterium]